MSFIKKTIQSLETVKSISLSPSTYPGTLDVSSTQRASLPFFFGNNGIDYKFSYSGIDSAMKAYQHCPPLTAIINRKAQMHINGKTWVLNNRGKEATSEEAKKLRKLLGKPNPLQSWKQFEAQQKIYIQLFGFCIVMPIIPTGYKQFGPIEATSLWNIPPYMVDIQETNKLFYGSDFNGGIGQIKLNYKGNQSFLESKDVYIFKDFTINFDSIIIPDSRVRSLEMPINNIIGAYESKNVLINYRGALGILTPETGSGQYVPLPLDQKEKEQLQDDFRRYGLSRSQWKFIISPAAMKWQQMGVPAKDLMLKEEIEDSTKAICDAYNYPPHLLGLIDPTFNNQREASKGAYQDGIIPEADSMYEEWNNFFRTADYNLNLNKDFSHIPILQEDKVKQNQARKYLDEAMIMEFKNNVITLNQWLEKLDEDPRPDEFGKMYYYQLVEAGWKFDGVVQQNNNTNGNEQQTNQAAG